MKINAGNKNQGWLLSGSGLAGEFVRRGLALTLSGLMVVVPMGQEAFAQTPLPVQPLEQQQVPQATGGDQAPQAEPLSNDQLDQLVAPVALYPDPLVAQVLAAATYPTQVVEANRWRKAQSSQTAEQLASGADTQNWDPSVKALIAFPSVLEQMDRNLQWTTDLGNAYYNQPQDVMDAIQAMRQKSQSAGQLRSTPQMTVSNDAGTITIAPANPTVVYVPVYDPWAVYGAPLVVYPGYWYGPPPGIFWGGLAIGFGIGIGIGWWGHYGWGWGHWGCGWGHGWGYGGYHGVVFNHNTYISRSSTVINRGVNRPGGPPRNFAGARGAYGRPAGSMNSGYRGAAGMGRSNVARPTSGMARPQMSRPGGTGGSYGRPGGAQAAGRPAGSPAGSNGRPGGNSNGSGRSNTGGGGRPSGSGAAHSSGHASGGAHASSGGHSSGGHK
jgi:hypothetical protein